MAQKSQLKPEDAYLAGIWRSDLICGLNRASDATEYDESHRDMNDLGRLGAGLLLRDLLSSGLSTTRFIEFESLISIFPLKIGL